MSDAAPAPKSSLAGCLKWPSIAAVCIVGIISFTLLRSCDRIQRLAETIFGGATSTKITEVVQENLIKATATQGDILEVATLDMDETLMRYDTKAILWNIIDIGTTVSEIKVPAVFRYHVKLTDKWEVYPEETRTVIIAPVIRASQPPAMRSDKMEKKSAAGWARFNAAQNLHALEKSITPSLEARAGNTSHIDKVRDPARQAVTAFARQWLLPADDPRTKNVVIVFADEPAATTARAHKPASTPASNLP